MKPIPSDPWALQARVMSAMCDDIFDMGAGRARSFRRVDALRQTINSSRDGGVPNKPLPTDR